MASQYKLPYQVLLVDDEQGDVELAKMALADCPFPCQVMVAGNGKEAMTWLRKQPPYADAPTPDLVLLDLNMPQMNGREVLKEMKGDAALTAIPVVVLTTSDVERDVVATYNLGASGYITKPVDMDDLFKAVHSVTEYWFSTVRRPQRHR
ncbi:MAG TPA: response regulator [Patescibacteria group bacterium]|nr:response regulator [Patescibacteria group bacterium]